MVSEVSIAGPGFINIRLNPAAKFSAVADALRLSATRSAPAPRAGKKVMVEFVSANPTGPLHTGTRVRPPWRHLCNLLETQGCTVHREFYYNDAGNQIDNPARRCSCARWAWSPGSALWPEDGYRGDYIVEIGKAYLERGGDVNDLNAMPRATPSTCCAMSRTRTSTGLRRQEIRLLLPRELAPHRWSRRQTVAGPQGLGPHLRAGRRAVAEDHRLRRR